MTELSHDEIDELLGAYAVEALPPEEMRQVEAHLRTCATHRELAAELRETLTRLAFKVPERQPSPIARPDLPGDPEGGLWRGDRGTRAPRPARPGTHQASPA